jgi:hypothetical protein
MLKLLIALPLLFVLGFGLGFYFLSDPAAALAPAADPAFPPGEPVDFAPLAHYLDNPDTVFEFDPAVRPHPDMVIQRSMEDIQGRVTNWTEEIYGVDPAGRILPYWDIPGDDVSWEGVPALASLQFESIDYRVSVRRYENGALAPGASERVVYATDISYDYVNNAYLPALHTYRLFIDLPGHTAILNSRQPAFWVNGQMSFRYESVLMPALEHLSADLDIIKRWDGEGEIYVYSPGHGLRVIYDIKLNPEVPGGLFLPWRWQPAWVPH